MRMNYAAAGLHGEVMLKNALHNLSMRENGSDHEFSKGVLVGVVAAIMATGASFESALAIAKQHSPGDDVHPARVPEGWIDAWDRV